MRRRIFFVSRRADVPYLNSLHQEHLCMRNMLVCTNIAVLAPLSEAWKLHEADLDIFLLPYRCTTFPLISKAFAGASCCTALGDLWASVALEASPNTAHSGKQAQQRHLQRGCLSWLAPRANQVRRTLNDIQLSFLYRLPDCKICPSQRGNGKANKTWTSLERCFLQSSHLGDL